MSAQVTSISKARQRQLNSKKFCRKYHRLEREANGLSDSNVPEHQKAFLDPNLPDCHYVAVPEAPIDGLKLICDFDLFELVTRFNALLWYRMLKLMYGPPDVVGALVGTSPATLFRGTLDWGYTFRAGDAIVAEIRSMYNNKRLLLRFWSEGPLDDNKKESLKQIIQDCCEDLSTDYVKNLNLFNESEQISAEEPFLRALVNTFAEKYRAAEELLVLAKVIDKRPERKVRKYDEAVPVHTAGSMYTASAMFFVIALESFLNILYRTLLQDEYWEELYESVKEPYERVTIKADLEVRLLTMHLYCKGFLRPAVRLDSTEWDSFRRLRAFRNNIVHGNVTKEHVVYSFIEDNIGFYYKPFFDFMGTKEENKAVARLPLQMAAIDAATVESIKETVDALIQLVLSALDEKAKTWVESWVHDIVILPFFSP